MAGRQISHYRILSLLGAGGMGEVYLAEDTRLGRKVALKLLPAQFTQDAERVRRFEREARAASALNHPNIITIYEIGESDGRHFIATEFIPGHTLRQQMKHARTALREVLDAATQVASALAAAHAAGIVHRDIKPENLMVRPDGLVKVLDFGLAKLTERRAITPDTEAPTSGGGTTEPGVVMGTANYMSPEQARGLEVDARSDIFSFGVVLYEMVAGRAPFAAATATDIILAIVEKEPPPLSRYSAAIPEALEWMVSKALVKEREERYQTARELLTDLKRLKHRLESEREMTAAHTSSADFQAAAPAPMIAQSKRQAPWVWVAAAVLLLVALAALATLYFQRAPAELNATYFFLPLPEKTTHSPLTTLTGSAISPDGSRIIFASFREGTYSLYQKGVSGGDQEGLLLKAGTEFINPTDWSGDGQFIVYRQESPKTQFDLWVLPLVGDRQPRKYLASEFNEFWGRVSPDGRWMAYVSDESGSSEVYVQAFPEPGRKAQVSKGGGSHPRWRADGKGLFYLAADDKLMAVAVKGESGFEAGVPTALFETRGFNRALARYPYAVTADGQRFLIIQPVADASSRPLTVVQHWTAVLKR